MAGSVLDRAGRLAARRRFAEVIALLEPQVPLYRDSARFYRLLGLSCLWTGDGSGAFTYLKRAEQLEPADPEVKLALASLSLRRGETEKAVALYLAVLESRPRDRCARRGLDFIRRGYSAERLAELIDSGGITRFYPRPKGLSPALFRALAVLALLAAVALALPLGRAAYARLSASRVPRPGVAAVELSARERADPVGAAGTSRYVLTEKEALAAFDRAKALFQAFRDNAALVELNRLEGSNAQAAIKEKARSLRAYAEVPDWQRLRDVPSYAEVRRDPRLYEGCAVAWKGRAANLIVDARGSSFDFLVGYEKKTRLEGVVPSRFADPAVAVPPERPFELLAVIRAAGDGSGFSLEALAVHELPEE